MLAFEDTVWYL